MKNDMKNTVKLVRWKRDSRMYVAEHYDVLEEKNLRMVFM